MNIPAYVQSFFPWSQQRPAIPPNTPRPVMPAPAASSALSLTQQASANYLSERIYKIAVRYANPMAQKIFYVQPLPGRLLIGFNRYAMPADMVAKIAIELRPALNNRLIIYKTEAPFFVQVTYEPVRAADASRLATLPTYPDRQVMVYGPTNAGKSTTVQHLLHAREGLKIYLDPHYQPGKCHPNTVVVGAGLDWNAIDSALDTLTLEMQNRYQRLKTGDVNFNPITIAVDELSAMTRNLPTAGARLIDLAQQGRKVRIYTILVPHSTEVEAMGFQGTGDARESFVFVQMHPVQPGQETKPRIATVYLGNPRRRGGNDPLGRFIVPVPTLYQGQARLVDDLSSIIFADAAPGSKTVSETSSRSVPETETPGTAPQAHILPYEQRYANGTPEAIALAEYLAAAGFSHRKIARLLPFKYETALAVANTALRTVNLRQPKPAPGSNAERALAIELYRDFGVPLHRIAALLDGNDHANLTRLQSYLSRSF